MNPKDVRHMLGGTECRELTPSGECGRPATDGLCEEHREDRHLYLTNPKAYADRVDARKGN